jgi:DNA-directed RNA polymerase subunit RPC12/RpoP
MAFCSRCGVEIDHLNAYDKHKSILSINSNGHAFYDLEIRDGRSQRTDRADDTMSYECPVCKQELTELANDEDKAVAFLKGAESKHGEK